ncbi:MAG: glycerophosphodiester phosphodiesterase family protein [Crocinitomicaceae bacterium]
MRWLIYFGILAILTSCKKEFHNLNTVVLGHAGESLLKSRSKYPPDTFKSAERAINLGATGVEIDVQMTADSILVAYHDPELSENSDGSGCINSLNYNEIKNFKVYKSDQTIDLLSDFLDITIKKGKELFLDVKHANACTNTIIDYQTFNNTLNTILIGYTNAEKNLITINCRDYHLLEAVTDTTLNLAYEYDDVSIALPIVLANGYDKLTIKLEALDQTMVDVIKNAGVSFGIYNMKTRSEVYEALEYAPDFVISDNIECTLKALNE